MGRGIQVPINPDVLAWAIRQSGFDQAEVAQRLKVSETELENWIRGKSLPLKGKFQRLAEVLKRPTAVFLLDSPPKFDIPEVAFRHPIGTARHALNPKELRHLREIGRIQRTLGWISERLGEHPVNLPIHSIDDEPESIATRVREQLGISIDDQLGWQSEAKAQHSWRTAIEAQGIPVFFLPLGEDSIRGFSVFHDYLPFIAVNTAWNYQARIFSMFHEYGHLLTRTSSACLEPASQFSRHNTNDRVERWCEEFASAVVLPRSAVENLLQARFRTIQQLQIKELDQLYWLSNKFKISARATALKLIEMGLASWDLFHEIPKARDKKSKGGGSSSEGRDRLRIRQDEYGRNVSRLFMDGVDRDLISRAEALGFLKISSADFDNLRDWAV